jgi:hypothetical protein
MGTKKAPAPTLLICGAPRAGTTSLYQYLRQHPDVCMSTRKETGVFLENYDKVVDWLIENYLTHYSGESVVGEATTGHMQHLPSAQRMAETVPQARLVFILRDPVERIHSHYRFHRRSGTLTAEPSFSELIRNESSEWRRIHLDNGLYYKHLTRFVRHFDRQQMKVFLFRDLKADTETVVQELYTFARVDPTISPDVSRRHNAGGLPRNERTYRTLQRVWQAIRRHLGTYLLDTTQAARDRLREWLTTDAASTLSMSSGDRAYLQEFYREPNRRLQDWLDADVSHWT